jgi:hypothetical protein
MDAEHPPLDQDTFVIRMWATGLPGPVRGHVQHLRSRQSAYFANRQRLQAFIEEHLRNTDAATPTGQVRRRRRHVDVGLSS